MRMHSLKHNSEENVHVLHQSLFFLILKVTLAWIITVAIMLVLEMSWTIIRDLFSSSGTLISVESDQGFLTDGLVWEVMVHLVLLVFYGWLVLFIVLGWIYNYYIIEPKDIIIRKGIISSKEDRFNMKDMQSIEVQQGLWGKVFSYGTIRLFNRELKKEIILKDISEPYSETAFIDKYNPNTSNEANEKT